MALPTFEWVKNDVQQHTKGPRNPIDPGFFRAWVWAEFELSAAKGDSRLRMLAIAEAIRVFLPAWIFKLYPALVA
jgi:hypothetical protein